MPSSTDDRVREKQFKRITRALIRTEVGTERTMYGPIRDLFREILDYSPDSVTNEPPLAEGTPDLLVSIPHPAADGAGDKLPVIVVEAKDEHGSVLSPDLRESILTEKAKYIGFATKWFVLIDPEAIVARPVCGGRLADGDLAFEWDDPEGLAKFLASMDPLSAARMSFDDELSKFREGDTSLIASVKLEDGGGDPATRQFFSALRDGAASLQMAVAAALEATEPEIETIRNRVQEFEARFNDACVEVAPIHITGAPQSAEETREFTRERLVLERLLKQRPRLSRLALKDLHEIAERAEVGNDRSKLFDLVSAETANLVLARILLIRFFEDHGFFGDKKYVCNGGLEAVQHIMNYFDHGYTYLLQMAYGEAGSFYGAAFAETGFDWILEEDTELFSRALEWVLFTLSKFDFTTVRGDVLAGIYERFLDRSRRKRFGEFYTPPSIARFMIERSGVRACEPLLDPACGSGTFLIEAYELLAGEPARRGVAGWQEGQAVIDALAGNDINPFAAVLTQIQLLWHLLPFRQQIAEHGFPELHVAEGCDALRVRDLLAEPDQFSEIDVGHYAAVVANPPYVRSERQSGSLDVESRRFYDEEISADTNLFSLFIYRALRSWCRPPTDENEAGRIAFVIPLSFAEAKQSASLRKLFQPNERWAIREIVDLEQIGPLIFDADVVPMILIAERRPAEEDDKVTVRIANQSVVRPGTASARVQFDLAAGPTVEMPYAQIFAPDGRIRTRLNARRHEILSKLDERQALTDIARPYWVKIGARNRLVAASTDSAVLNHPTERWEPRRMISGGVAFRRTYEKAETGGVDVYKGENIISLDLIGECPFPQTDMAVVDDPALWRFPEVLPHIAYAVPVIEQLPNGVRFNPHQVAFTNTATIFVPEQEYEAFPFDLLLHSRIYRFAYAFGYRMGVLYRRRSHMYPENVGQLPWSNDLTSVASEIEGLREPLISSYQLIHDEEASLQGLVDGLGMRKLREVALRLPDMRITWGDIFEDPEYEAEVVSPSVTEAPRRIHLGESLFDWFVVEGHRELSDWIRLALELQRGRLVSRKDILDMLVPENAEQAAQLEDRLQEIRARDPIQERDELLDQLDGFVGPALGLSETDISDIQRDLRNDPFARTLGVREPYTETRLVGSRTSLTSPDRYR